MQLHSSNGSLRTVVHIETLGALSTLDASCLHELSSKDTPSRLLIGDEDREY